MSSLNVSGNTIINGVLNTLGDIMFVYNSNLTYLNQVLSNLAVSIANKANITNISVLNNITIKSSLFVSGYSIITGDTTINNSLNIGDSCIVNKNLIISGTSTLNGATTINNSLNVSGYTILNTTSINSSLNVSGYTIFNNLIRLPILSTSPNNSNIGDIYYNTSNSNIYIYNGSWNQLLTSNSINQSLYYAYTSGYVEILANTNAISIGTFTIPQNATNYSFEGWFYNNYNSDLSVTFTNSIFTLYNNSTKVFDISLSNNNMINNTHISSDILKYNDWNHIIFTGFVGNSPSNICINGQSINPISYNNQVITSYVSYNLVFNVTSNCDTLSFPYSTQIFSLIDTSTIINSFTINNGPLNIKSYGNNLQPFQYPYVLTSIEDSNKLLFYFNKFNLNVNNNYNGSLSGSSLFGLLDVNLTGPIAKCYTWHQ